MPDSDSSGALIASLLISTVGLAMFVYGRKQRRVPQLAAGVLLMVFPYFVPTVWIMIAIAVGICALTALLVRMGA